MPLLIARIPWARRTWALPFLTALAPGYNYPAYVWAKRPHKPLLVSWYGGLR